MLATLLSCALAWQEPRPADKRPPAPAAKEASADASGKGGKGGKGDQAGKGKVASERALDDKTAKAALEAWNKVKGKPTFDERATALDQLGNGTHKLLVPALVAVVTNDKSAILQKRAATLLADQEPAEALAAIRKLLKNPKLTEPLVLTELVRGLVRCGYDKSHWADVEPLFERAFGQESVPLQEAILDLAKTFREKQAVPLLLRHLDEPAPADVNSGDNPPTEYWEARWKSWQAWRDKVVDALLAITGQKFGTAAEAQQWLKKNPLK